MKISVILPQYTEVRFASFLSGGFTSMTVETDPLMTAINPPESKLAKRTSVHYPTFEGVFSCLHRQN